LAYNHPDLGYINKIQKQLMATARPFAYNTGAGITGTVQVGALAVGTPTDGFATTGLEWWNGPDEDLGYVLFQVIHSQPKYQVFLLQLDFLDQMH
jgi:hypothetical protein